jgi:hypothetical protein
MSWLIWSILSFFIYRLQKKFKFSCCWETFVDVDVKELNNVLRTSEHIEVDEDGDEIM